MPNSPGHDSRRYPRLQPPRGVWVSWQDGTHQDVSRVHDLNVGGLFITTGSPSQIGAVLSLLLAVPEGQIRAKAVVRNVSPAKGMGVEFTELHDPDASRLQSFLKRITSSHEN